MSNFLRIAVTLAALGAASCSHFNQEAPKSAPIAVSAKLTIVETAPGVYDFKYDAPFADQDGNFDFSQKGALGSSVNMSFTIAEDSGLGLKFKPQGSDAIWIVDKKNVGPDGSPQGPYRGDQFRNFSVSPDGRTLNLFNQNDDGVLYRYGLRFDRGALTVVDDPDNQNGGHTGGTGGNN
ncbi:MAG: hypothetical protein U5J99_12045 [Parvularculaceae bacterium]|nr:hypothetical protein [Parvularculaceae bacterium]